MISTIVSRLVILLFGTLYPAYASYKAVRTKNVKEYVKWMMYWIVFALFTCAETFTDVFLSFWFPFYYEIKIIIVIWLLSPATKGSSILYRKFVHPMLCKREQEIDEYISRAKEQGYHTMLHLGSKSVTYATTVIMQTAIKGGGGIVNHLRRSYSLSDLSSDPELKADVNRNSKALPEDAMDAGDPTRELRLRAARKAGGSHVDLYFPEMDVDVRSHSHNSRETSAALNQIRSSEDISSGYSSADGAHGDGSTLLRTASVGAPRRLRGGRGGRSRRATTEDIYQGISTDDLIEFGTQQFPGYSHPLAPLFPVLLSDETTSPSLNKTLTHEILNVLQILLNKKDLVTSNILDNEEYLDSFLTVNTCSEEEYEISIAKKEGNQPCIDRGACDSSQCADSECTAKEELNVVTTLAKKNGNSDTVIACVDVGTLNETEFEKEVTRGKVNVNIASNCSQSQLCEEVNNISPDAIDPRVAGKSSENEHPLTYDNELFVDAEEEDLYVEGENQTEQPVEFQYGDDKIIQENIIIQNDELESKNAKEENLCMVQENQTEQSVEFQYGVDNIVQENIIKSDELESKKVTVFTEDHLLHVEDAESVASSTDDQSNYGDSENLDNNAKKSRKGKYHKLRAPEPPTPKADVGSCIDEDEKKVENKNSPNKTSLSLERDAISDTDWSIKNNTERLRREFFSSDSRTENAVIDDKFRSAKASVSTDTSEYFKERDFTKNDGEIELNKIDMKTESKGKSRLNIFSSVKKILQKSEEGNEKMSDGVLVSFKGDFESEINHEHEEDTPKDKVIIRQMSSSPSQKKRFLFG